MDVSPVAFASAAAEFQQGKVAQSAQILVLKKAMDIEASSAQAMLQALPSTAHLPLATSGNLGTQVNTMA